MRSDPREQQKKCMGESALLTMTYGEYALTNFKDDWEIFEYVEQIVLTRDSSMWSPGEQCFGYSAILLAQVNNGGFDQYFFNKGYLHAIKTRDVLVKAKSIKAASLLSEAISIAEFKEDSFGRYEYESTFLVRGILNKLDFRFYGFAEKEINRVLVKYLRVNTHEFS